MTAKRAYRFRPDGPNQTKPPVMVKVNGALCEARNIAVAMALDGAHPTTIWNKFRGAVTGHQISQWLYEARKLGLNIPRHVRPPRSGDGTHYRAIAAYVDRLAATEQARVDRELIVVLRGKK